jgi:hypothetical protein
LKKAQETSISYSDQQLLDNFRSKLAARGSRGIVGLGK